MDGNIVYYLPDNPDPITMKTRVSDLQTPCKTTEQVISLSPVKGGNSSVVTINTESILGRFDPDTLNSLMLNQILDEVVENPNAAAESLSVPDSGVTPLEVPPLSTQGMSSHATFESTTSKSSSISSYNLNVNQCVNSVGPGTLVAIPQENTTPVTQALPDMKTLSTILKKQPSSATLSQSVAIPLSELTVDQSSSQMKDSEISLSSNNTASILDPSALSQSEVVSNPVLTNSNSSASGESLGTFQNVIAEQGSVQSHNNFNSLTVTSTQNVPLQEHPISQLCTAFSTYQPVEVISTPSSQYQQSIMSTTKSVPQLEGTMASTSLCSYIQSSHNLDPNTPLVRESQGSVPQNLTDQNMNNIQLPSEIAELFQGRKQISAKTPSSNHCNQNKGMARKFQHHSRNGFKQNSGLPVPNIPGSLCSLPSLPASTFTQGQHYSQTLPTGVSQFHPTGLESPLAPTQPPPPYMRNFTSLGFNSPANGALLRRTASCLSSPIPSSSMQRYPLSFYSPRPQSSTQGFFMGTFPGYSQNGGFMTNGQRSQQPSRPKQSLKLMPKNQMMEVKKTISTYWPDFSNYPEVCVCEKCDLGTEIHVDQIWLYMNQMYYLPQIHVLAIGCDELVGILREDKYFVSVREVIYRLIPKFQRDVENYLLQARCEVDTMTGEEFAYLMQRGCIDSQIYEIISLESLREMCRFLLNSQSELSSETRKLTEAATGVYYRKILEKHTRCSRCGGAVKCNDLLDRYEAVDCPVGITYKEQKMALLQKEVIENSPKKKSAAMVQKPQQKITAQIEKIKIGRLLVGGTQFNTFQIKDKCFVSLRELVAYKLLTLQVLQSRLESLSYRPRPAPGFVDKYFIQNNIEAYNTLWIDTVIVRCMCCFGQQKTQMPLQKHFKCGDLEVTWDKELEGLDEGDMKGVVYTLNPDTVTISNKKFLQAKVTPKPVVSNDKETKLTMGPKRTGREKPLIIKMRDLQPSKQVNFVRRTGQLTSKTCMIDEQKISDSNENSPMKTQTKIIRDVNLGSTSLGQDVNSNTSSLNNFSSGMESQNAQPTMTEESILEIAAREAMLIPSDLDDTDGTEYPITVDSVIQSIGMSDGLPSEEYVMEEIEREGLNIFDGVLSVSICGDNGSKVEEITDKQPDKRKELNTSSRKLESGQIQSSTSTKKGKEGRKKRVPKRFEEYDLDTNNISQNDHGNKIRYYENMPRKKDQKMKKLRVFRAPSFRNHLKKIEKEEAVLSVIKHSEMEGISEMISRNQEEAASVSPVADDEEVTITEENKKTTPENNGETTDLDTVISVSVTEPSEHSLSAESPFQNEMSLDQINENNIEKLCSPIKELGNNSDTSSPNTSFTSLSENSKTSRYRRACDKVAALESSQDECRILHMLATVAEVVNESGDEKGALSDQKPEGEDPVMEACDISATVVEPSAVCESVQSAADIVDSLPDAPSNREQLSLSHDQGSHSERSFSNNYEGVSEPVEEDFTVIDNTDYSPILISEDEVSDGDNEPVTMSQEKKLEQFISAVNKYIDIVEIQTEPGIITSKIRFLQGANLVFPGRFY